LVPYPVIVMASAYSWHSVLAKSSLRPLLCVDARYLAGRSLNLNGLEILEQHKEPGFHLYIALSGKRSVTEMKWRLVTEWYSCPNHNICATPSVYLINAASGKIFILTSPNPYSTVCIRNIETGFVRKQHFLPSLPCPLQMGSSPC
jgi:hypothetical protein